MPEKGGKLPPRRKDNLHREWSCDEVCSWVAEVVRKEGIPGERMIVAAFQEQGIKGSHLEQLTPALLRDELKFQNTLGQRLSFLQVIHACKSACFRARVTSVTC